MSGPWAYVWELSLKHRQRGAVRPFALFLNCRIVTPVWFAPKLAHMNIWIHHGDSDTTVPYKGNLDMFDRLKANGAGDNVKLTTYEGKDHNITGITGKDTAIIEWLFSQRRK